MALARSAKSFAHSELGFGPGQGHSQARVRVIVREMVGANMMAV